VHEIILISPPRCGQPEAAAASLSVVIAAIISKMLCLLSPALLNVVILSAVFRTVNFKNHAG
jgi:hypothetical protein